jgi:hypothetical protein
MECSLCLWCCRMSILHPAVLWGHGTRLWGPRSTARLLRRCKCNTGSVCSDSTDCALGAFCNKAAGRPVSTCKVRTWLPASSVHHLCVVVWHRSRPGALYSPVAASPPAQQRRPPLAESSSGCAGGAASGQAWLLASTPLLSLTQPWYAAPSAVQLVHQ